MTAHIIHDKNDLTRWRLLKREIDTQHIDIRLWPFVKHFNAVVGCMRAHKQIIQFAKDNHLPEVLILEDDVQFTAPGAFDYFISNKPKDYDLYFGGILFGKLEADGTVRRFAGTHCWMIHSRFYDTVLNTKEGMNIDTALAKAGKYIVCNPMVAKQHDVYSNREKKIPNRKHHYKDYSFFTNNPHYMPVSDL